CFHVLRAVGDDERVGGGLDRHRAFLAQQRLDGGGGFVGLLELERERAHGQRLLRISRCSSRFRKRCAAEGQHHREQQENACEFHRSAGNLSSKIITTFVSLPSFGISTIVASWDEYVSTNDFVAVIGRCGSAARTDKSVCATCCGAGAVCS